MTQHSDMAMPPHPQLEYLLDWNEYRDSISSHSNAENGTTEITFQSENKTHEIVFENIHLISLEICMQSNEFNLIISYWNGWNREKMPLKNHACWTLGLNRCSGTRTAQISIDVIYHTCTSLRFQIGDMNITEAKAMFCNMNSHLRGMNSAFAFDN